MTPPHPVANLDLISAYYSAKLQMHGATPQGVDWNGAEGQRLRFEQLMRVRHGDEPFTVNDLGCGWGALFDYLKPDTMLRGYLGVDVAADMVALAHQREQGDLRARFETGTRPSQQADYTVASGIFNVRLNLADAPWVAHMTQALDVMHETSRKGFAFNALTSYSDPDRQRPDLHYADPCHWFDHCVRRYGRHVALLHDYGLYEFTLLVRRHA